MDVTPGRRQAGIVQAAGSDVDFAGQAVVGEGELRAAGGAKAAGGVIAGTKLRRLAGQELKLAARDREPGHAGRAGGAPAHEAMADGLARCRALRLVPDCTAITAAAQHDHSPDLDWTTRTQVVDFIRFEFTT